MADSPITGICIVDKKINCPPQYTLIDRTAEGEDSDLWKDGFFKSKVTRYICYSTNITAGQWNHVVTNIILIGIKDPVPQGFVALRETTDTKESALKKHVLCIKLMPKTATDSAVVDFKVMRSERYKAEQYTCVGEVNGINLVYKLQRLPQSISNRPAPPLPVAVENVPPLGSPPPIPRRPPSVKSSSGTGLSTLEPLAAISGVPFKLHDRLMQSNSDANMQDDLHITLKTKSELDELFNYDFSRERGVIGR
ncbi:multivesicular body subunit 12B-like [Styela clava]